MASSTYLGSITSLSKEPNLAQRILIVQPYLILLSQLAVCTCCHSSRILFSDINWSKRACVLYVSVEWEEVGLHSKFYTLSQFVALGLAQKKNQNKNELPKLQLRLCGSTSYVTLSHPLLFVWSHFETKTIHIHTLHCTTLLYTYTHYTYIHTSTPTPPTHVRTHARTLGT